MADVRGFVRRHWALIGFVILSVAMLVSTYRVETLADENRRYMCNFVNDLRERHQASLEYLSDVERGRRPIITGLTLVDLQRSIDTQKATLDSFRGLDCG